MLNWATHTVYSTRLCGTGPRLGGHTGWVYSMFSKRSTAEIHGMRLRFRCIMLHFAVISMHHVAYCFKIDAACCVLL